MPHKSLVGACGRADLLYALASVQKNVEDIITGREIALSEILRFSLKPTEQRTDDEDFEKPTQNSPVSDQPIPETTELNNVFRPFRLVGVETLQSNEAWQAQRQVVDKGTLTNNDMQPWDASRSAPKATPIVPWTLLWPRLRQAVAYKNKYGINFKSLANDIARGIAIHQLPRLHHLAWPNPLTVVLDFSDRLTPYWDDWHKLRKQLQTQLHQQVSFYSLQGVPQRRLQLMIQGKPSGHFIDWPKLKADSTLLLVSDLGMIDPAHPWPSTCWQSKLNTYRRLGVKVVILAPVSVRHLQPSLVNLAQTIRLSPDSTLRPVPRLRPGRLLPKVDASEGGKALMALLSVATRVESALLRDLRRCLTDGGHDAGLEGEVWCHQHLDTSAIACAISPYAVKDWRKEFQQLSPALQQRTLQCLRDWHAQLPQAIHHEETLVWYHLTNSFDDAESMHINQARAFFQRLTNSLQQKNLAMVNLDARALQLQLADRHLQWVSPVLASKERYIIDLSVSVTEADTNRTDTVLEEGIDPVAWLMALPVLPSQKLKLIQQADSRLGLCVGFTPEAAALGVSPLTDLELDRSVILLAEGEHGLTGGYRTWFWQTAPQDKPLVLPPLLIGGDEFIKTTSVFSIYTGQQKLRFERLAMPSWASGMGQDNYGLYADLELQGIILRFRWINPGSFLMGSPEDEEGRSDYEDLHLVTLSQGFWLAETTVTQALWQVVMSKNRSVFKGDKRPVENVMWDEVLRFIDRLNQMFPEVHSRLPWEAEWEYACRAGSHTPFNFDGAVTLDRVNFRGSWDYEEGVWGKDALRETAEVKTYPCNAWGLYEMHGNVWEWCQDGWQRNLGKEAVCDPWQWQQPLVGFSARVARGGSWYVNGRFVRSASRSRDSPVFRSYDLGFRLALGHAEFQSGQGSGTSGPVATYEDAGRRVAEQRQTGSSSVADDVKK